MVIILPPKKKIGRGKCVGVPPPLPLSAVFRAGTMLSETFCQDCGSVGRITYLVWCGMVMVVVLLGVRGEVTVNNHKFIKPSEISMLDAVRLLAQPKWTANSCAT